MNADAPAETTPDARAIAARLEEALAYSAQLEDVQRQYMVAVSWLENATGMSREEINVAIARRLAKPI